MTEIKTRSSRIILSGILLLMAFAGLTRAAESQPPFCLDEIVARDGRIFFVDFLEPTSTYAYKVQRIPLVSVDYAVHADVDTWIDRRGLVHTSAYLRRQKQFNDWLEKMQTETSIKPLSTFAPDDSTVSLAAIPLTGLMDRETLWASYYEMRYRLDNARRNFKRLCRMATNGQSDCQRPPWPEEIYKSIASSIEAASQALARYGLELETIPFSPPPSADYHSNLCLKISDPALLGRTDSISDFEISNSPPPELAVSMVVDFAALGEDKIDRFASLEKDVRAQIHSVDVMVGDPR